MKVKRHIDFWKGAALPLLATLVIWNNATNSPTACIYTVMHGSYGVLWCLKSYLFPDKAWEHAAGIGGTIVVHVLLPLYLLPGFLMISRGAEAPLPVLSLCLLTYITGVFFHFCSDMQKYTRLQMKSGLITDSLFGLSRNPNYFGEILIYGSFVAVTSTALGFIWPAAYLLFNIMILWTPRMREKDQSLSRHPGFKEYKAKTAIVIPFIL